MAYHRAMSMEHCAVHAMHVKKGREKKECGGEEVECIKQRLELLYCKIERLGTGFLPRQDAYLDWDRCLDGWPAVPLPWPVCLRASCCRALSQTPPLRSAPPAQLHTLYLSLLYPTLTHHPPPTPPRAVALLSHSASRTRRPATLLCPFHLPIYLLPPVHPSQPADHPTLLLPPPRHISARTFGRASSRLAHTYIQTTSQAHCRPRRRDHSIPLPTAAHSRHSLFPSQSSRLRHSTRPHVSGSHSCCHPEPRCRASPYASHTSHRYPRAIKHEPVAGAAKLD